ncbi:unnamed protein product [Heterobilharzia americana]|nr:unnamed protein product [Heterobilharzia americana]
MFKKVTSLFVQSFYFKLGIFNHPPGIHTTPIAMSEPLKKKKRVDPIIEQQRTGRKVRKIEKEIKRLSRFDRKLKPIEDIEGDRQLIKESKSRQRPPIDISENEIDQRMGIWKKWTRYQLRVSHRENALYKSVLTAQQQALDWLYKTSPNLYKEAIKPCSKLIGESISNSYTEGEEKKKKKTYLQQ